MAKQTNKWVRDVGYHDRHCAWHLMAVADDELEPIASVFPEWEGSARMSGRPSHYKAMVHGVTLGIFATIRTATKMVDLHMVLPITEGTAVVRLSTGERGTVEARIPAGYVEPMYRVLIGSYFGTYKPSEIAVVS